MDDYLTVCEQAARAGGAVLVEWADKFTVREKGANDLVTEADVASQEKVRSILLGAFPDHRFLSEEDPHGAAQFSSAPRWIVDPLDGTTNYVHRIPEFAVSIALEIGGEVVAGCVYSPLGGECYTARRGGGAFLNGRPIRASSAQTLKESLIAVSFPPEVRPESKALADFNQVIVRCQSMRRTGSAALNLCYVAAGRFDAYFARETKIWDIAAGSLIIQEAGGVITGLDGSPLKIERPQFIAAATEPLRQEIERLIVK